MTQEQIEQAAKRVIHNEPFNKAIKLLKKYEQ